LRAAAIPAATLGVTGSGTAAGAAILVQTPLVIVMVVEVLVAECAVVLVAVWADAIPTLKPQLKTVTAIVLRMSHPAALRHPSAAWLDAPRYGCLI
jgi:hypothetical protein